MGESVLIVADDLSGAADSGVAFAVHGMDTAVVWDGAAWGGDVLVVDTDSRHCPADRAGELAAAALRDHGHERLVFKKIDSTLRGNLRAEISALAGHGRPVVVCPASPATGRIVLDGVLHVDGIPLHHTDSWAVEGSSPPRSVADALRPLTAAAVPLSVLRGPDAAASLAQALTTADVVVCDAVTTEDLRAVVAAGFELSRSPHWVGSAGLAEALASALRPNAHRSRGPAVAGSTLAVIGSAHAASRAQADVLATRFLHTARLPVHDLLEADEIELTRRSERLSALLDEGDVVVTPHSDRPMDATVAHRLNRALARVCAPASRRAGLLVLTGGETARAVLARCGATSLRLLDELAPGVVLSQTTQSPPTHVITKAGGFGSPHTLHNAIETARSRAVRERPQWSIS